MEQYGLKEESIKAIVQTGQECGMERILLFGSRARGDFRPRSDIDLAVCGGDPAVFALEIDETVPTLLKFDVVDLNQPIQKELQDSIEKGGVVLYEKI